MNNKRIIFGILLPIVAATPLIAISCGDTKNTQIPPSTTNKESLANYILTISYTAEVNTWVNYNNGTINIKKILTQKDIDAIDKTKTLEAVVKLFLSFDKTPGTIEEKYKKLNTNGYDGTDFDARTKNWVLDLVDKPNYYKVIDKIWLEAKKDEVIWFHIPKFLKPIIVKKWSADWVAYNIKTEDIEELHTKGKKAAANIIRANIMKFMLNK